jgi:hypothetical protein
MEDFANDLECLKTSNSYYTDILDTFIANAQETSQYGLDETSPEIQKFYKELLIKRLIIDEKILCHTLISNTSVTGTNDTSDQFNISPASLVLQITPATNLITTQTSNNNNDSRGNPSDLGSLNRATPDNIDQANSANPTNDDASMQDDQFILERSQALQRRRQQRRRGIRQILGFGEVCSSVPAQISIKTLQDSSSLSVTTMRTWAESTLTGLTRDWLQRGLRIMCNETISSRSLLMDGTSIAALQNMHSLT